MEKSKKQNRIAIVIVGGLLLCSLLIWFMLKHYKPNEIQASIYQDGVLIQTVDLEKVETPYELTITGEHGEKNIIKVEPEGISIVEATCPDKLCMKTGVIHNGLVPIVCLPNKLMIKIEGGETQGYDGKTY